MTPAHPVTFPRERLGPIAAAEDAHFWHAPRRTLLLDTIAGSGLARGARVLDIGCGTGRMVRELLARGLDARGIDPWARESGLEAPRFAAGQAEAIPMPDASFDAACAFDVLEHVDDARALAEIHRVLAPGGWLFASVPAPRLTDATRRCCSSTERGPGSSVTRWRDWGTENSRVMDPS